MGRPKGSKNGRRTLIEFVCERCGKPFTRKPSDAEHARFCSMECYKPRPAQVACEGCGKLYTPSSSERGRFCSNACKRRRIEKHCLTCGKNFSIRASKAAKYRYCSLACRPSTAVLRTCEHCGKTFTVNHARGDQARFCSYDCLYAASRVAITCAYCGQEKTLERYRVIREGARFCSNRCATLFRMHNGWEPGYLRDKLRTGYRTDIEAMVEIVLQRLGITYLFEHRVGRYFVDFALPQLGIALECDGWQHFTTEGKERDRKRDTILQNEGWHVIHIADSDIRRDADIAVRNALNLIPAG